MDPLSAAQSVVAVLGVIYGIKRLAEDGWALLPIVSILVGLVGWGDLLPPRATARRSADRRDVCSRRRRSAPHWRRTSLGLFMVLRLVPVHHPVPATRARHGTTGGRIVDGAFRRRVCPRIHGGADPGAQLPSSERHRIGLLLVGAGLCFAHSDCALPNRPWMLLGGMLAFCIGLSPIGAITTDLVMGAAPPERAGAASAISETSFEFGGALGIAVLGSLFTFVYGRGMHSAADLGTLPTTQLKARVMASALQSRWRTRCRASRARNSCRRRARRSSTPLR